MPSKAVTAPFDANHALFALGERTVKWDDGKRIHLCEMTTEDGQSRLVWTKCQKDVPANQAFYSREKITCKECLK